MAKTIGFSAMDFNILTVNMFALDSPIKTSAPTRALSKDLIFLFVANSFFSSVRFSLSLLITPLLSVIIIFSSKIPRDLYNLPHEIAAAPAPDITIFKSEIFLFASSEALIKAAAEIIAVPC